MTLKQFITVTILLAASFGSTAAEWAIPRIQQELVIDAELDEAAWQDAKVIDIVYDTWPAENTPAPVETIAKVMENGEYLYIAFIAKDPNPSAIRAFYRDRDKLWDDDSVGIKIDSYHDSKLAYQLFINPFGVQADAIENEITKNESDAWDGIWQSAGKITAEGYQVEVAIPLRMLNFNDRLTEQRWKMEFLRFYPRDVRHRLSSNKIERNNPCWICQMNTVTGFQGATAGKRFSLVPALVTGASQQRSVTPSANGDWKTENTLEPSLDLKWGVTPDVSLSATLNPDFSQVEADEAQVSVNDTFALFFAEKRAFFLDNADYFSSPLDLVYTRNVSSPDAGVRLTGRHDQQSFAFFAANDKDTTILVPGNISSGIGFIDEKSENAVLRYRYDLNKQWSLGLISTLRQSTDYHNYVYGFDFKYQPTEQDSLIFQTLRSDSVYPQEFANTLSGESRLRATGDELADAAQFVSYRHEERNWNWYSRYLALGEEFRADMGYMPQTDFFKMVHGGGYQWFADNQWWNRFRISGDWDITHNEHDELLEKEAEMAVELWSGMQSFSMVKLIDRQRVGSRLDGKVLSVDANTGLFHEKVMELFGELQPWSGVYVALFTEFGDKLDFRNNRLGKGVQIEPEIRWNADAHTQFTVRHTFRTLDAAGAEVFTANLTDLRLSYQFSVRSFLRLALIYSDIQKNPLNNIGTVETRSKQLGSQLLYSYKINPQTLFFAGYSDNAFSDDDINSLTRDQRSVFLKFSYAWVQ